MAYTPTTWVDNVTPVNAANLNKVETGLDAADQAATDAAAAAETKIPLTEKAAVNGVASLDATGKVPTAQLPPVGADLSYDGDWVAGTYQDGDIVVKDGVAYLCVGGPTTVAPDPEPWGAALGLGVLDAKGDLIGATAPDTPARVPIGTDGQVLTADAAQALGLKWATPAAALPTRLGEYAELITDWSHAAARKNGWFMGTSVANSPGPLASNWSIGLVTAHNDIWVTQRVWGFTLAAGSPIYERRYLNGSWSAWVAGGVTGDEGYGTSLPPTPVNGQEYTLVDSVTAPTYRWRFRYNGGSSSPYKWEFVGGSPFTKYVAAAEGTTSVTPNFVNLATPMEFTLPRAGDYLLEGSVGEFVSTVGPGHGYVVAVQSSGVTIETSASETGGERRSIWVRGIINGAAAGHVAALRFAAVSGTTTFQRRLFTVQPIRVS